MDKIFARLCNQDGGNMEVMYTLFLFCNKLPIIPGADKAVVSRLLAVDCDSTWSDEAPDDPEEQFRQKLFKRDRTFEESLATLAPAAIWRFVQYYGTYRKEGLAIPVCVKNATDKYWRDNDMYKLFMTQCTEKARVPGTATPQEPEGRIDVTQKTKVSELYQAFKFFIRESYPNVKAPPIPDFQFQLAQRYGRAISGQYAGIVLKESVALI